MHRRISHAVALVTGGIALTVSVASAACSLAPTDPVRIKQMMATEIAYRLGLRPYQIPLNSITQPQLHTPLGLEQDCSGLGAFHHSAGFRIAEFPSPVPGPGPLPPGPSPRPGPHPGPGPHPWPGPGPDPTPWPHPRPHPAPGPGPGPWPTPVPGPHPGPDPFVDTTAAAPSQGSLRCVYEGVAVVLGYGYASPVAVNYQRYCR